MKVRIKGEPGLFEIEKHIDQQHLLVTVPGTSPMEFKHAECLYLINRGWVAVDRLIIENPTLENPEWGEESP